MGMLMKWREIGEIGELLWGLDSRFYDIYIRASVNKTLSHLLIALFC